MAEKSTGNCYLCGSTLGKTAMKNHLFKIHAEGGKQKCSLLKIEGAWDKGYWLYVDVPVDKTLEHVDIFLRKIWLECCGHMSAFSLPGSYGGINMGLEIEAFDIGEQLLHRYDFGTTTETLITFVGNTTRKPQKSPVRLLARNTPPIFKCEKCGEPATYIDTESNESVFYCEECGDELGGGEFFLPVVNSPRMGECGYEGEQDTFTFNPASIQK
jgi:ribosomal protein L37AE/L43A